MNRVLITTAAIAAAVVVFGVLTLPPARLNLPRTFDDGSVPGVMHIHTIRSDGRGTVDEIAAAAARAGLKFIVLTDHGDATRAADPPAYRSGVLCIDGVEVSTTGGHYVAVGMRQAPYPLGGEPRDVIEDVARLGGFGIAAHPDSPKAELRWQEWDAPIDAMEIINPDSGWRRQAAMPGIAPKLRLIERLLSYPVRPAETIAQFVAEPQANIDRWNTLLARRRVVAVAGADAHSKLALMSSEPGDTRFSLPIPGYETSFRTLSVHVAPGRPLTGDAVADSAAILDGLRRGHVYMSVDGVGAPAAFSLTGTSGDAKAIEGDELPLAPVALRVTSNAPAGFVTSVWESNRIVKTAEERDFTVALPAAPGVYRVEIHAADRAGAPVWLLSNPIYVGARPGAREPEAVMRGLSDSARSVMIFGGENSSDWQIEHEPTSSGVVDRAVTNGKGELHLRYALSQAGAAHQSVALLRDLTDGVYGASRLAFTAHADRPMRVSVQLRSAPDRGPQERWQRSIYLDTTDRTFVLPFLDFTVAGDSPAATTARPSAGSLRYVMFVVDGTNTPPGARGDVWLGPIALER